MTRTMGVIAGRSCGTSTTIRGGYRGFHFLSVATVKYICDQPDFNSHFERTIDFDLPYKLAKTYLDLGD
jgi:hypothetical protein